MVSPLRRAGWFVAMGKGYDSSSAVVCRLGFAVMGTGPKCKFLFSSPRLLRLGDRPDVRRGGDHVVKPLPVLAEVVGMQVEPDAEGIDLEAFHVAESEVGEIRDQLAVHPQGDTPVALARRIGLEHELVAVPAVQPR